VATNATANIEHTPTLLWLEKKEQIPHLFSRLLPLGAQIGLVP